MANQTLLLQSGRRGVICDSLNRICLLSGHGDLRCCGVRGSLILCGVEMNKIPSHCVAMISNCTVCGISDLKPTGSVETKLLVAREGNSL